MGLWVEIEWNGRKESSPAWAGAQWGKRLPHTQEALGSSPSTLEEDAGTLKSSRSHHHWLHREFKATLSVTLNKIERHRAISGQTVI